MYLYLNIFKHMKGMSSTPSPRFKFLRLFLKDRFVQNVQICKTTLFQLYCAHTVPPTLKRGGGVIEVKIGCSNVTGVRLEPHVYQIFTFIILIYRIIIKGFDLAIKKLHGLVKIWPIDINISSNLKWNIYGQSYYFCSCSPSPPYPFSSCA